MANNAEWARWDALGLARQLRRVGDGLRRDIQRLQEKHGVPFSLVGVLRDEYCNSVHEALDDWGSKSRPDPHLCADLIAWAEDEGHDGWPVDLADPPPLYKTCNDNCGAQYTRERWRSLTWCGLTGTHYGTNDKPRSMSLRLCAHCQTSLVVECTPPARWPDSFQVPRDWTDEQRALSGREVEGK